MTRMLVPAIRSWVRSEMLWRWRAVILTVLVPDASEALKVAMARQRRSLDLEAAELVEGLGDVAATNPKRAKLAGGLRSLILRSLLELRAMPPEAIAPAYAAVVPADAGVGSFDGLKGLGLPAAAAAEALAGWPKVWALGQKCVAALMTIATVTAAVTMGVLVNREFIRSDADRARDEAIAVGVLERERQAALARCALDPDAAGCRERTNKTYDALLPTECSILDTPLGSAIGAMVGIGFGYGGMRKIMGWT